MPIEILMPALSPTMEEGTLSKWSIKEGDTVTAGSVMAEIETDKATMEFEATDEGVLGKILVPEGTEGVKVGTAIGILLMDGESADDIKSGAENSAAPSQSAPAKAEKATPPAAPSLKSTPTPTPAPTSPPAKTAAPESGANDDGGGRVKASPLARRIAQEQGIDLSAVTGSGPHGRIIKADIDAFEPAIAPAEVSRASGQSAAVAPAPAASTAAPSSSITPPDGVPFEEVRLPGMRKVIARRMAESKSTVPHFYMTVDIELDELMAFRKKLNVKLESKGVKVSVNDLVIKACGLALKRVPDANAMYAGDKMYRFSRADISVAVAVEGGLVTPVIKAACTKGLADIASEMKLLASKAKDGTLMPEEYQGGTFSISNLGMMGIRQFDAVINPPQGAILAVGAGEQRPVVKDGALAIATVMSVTLSVDHRVLDGAIGAAFLAEVKTMLEDPMMMLA